MGIHVIKMPDIGEGIAEVELVAWHVQVGDTVVEDQVLADVMTDKATVEIPSAVSGKVLALGGAVGQVMAVGSEVIRIEVEGAGNLKEGDAERKVAPTQAKSAQAAPVSIATAMLQEAPASTPAPASSRAVAPAQAGNGNAARNAPATPAHHRAPGDKPIAAPSVRHRAWELGVELQYVPGTGPAGRISHADLDAYVARAARGIPSGGSDSRYLERSDEEAVPVIGLRRKIAQKMQEAKRRIPHFTYVEEVDMTELEALRQRLNAQHGKARGKLTVIPFLARAMVQALREFPHLNARYDDEADVLTKYGAVHLGLAAQTEAGLMVPVLRHAETMDLWACAAEVTRLAEAARTGKAAREELSGSTITLTSLGALGGIVSTPVINRPEVAIVGVNRMVERPMVRGGAVVVRQMMNLSSSFDHRVVDGMHAAEFIQKVRGYLECPATLFVE
ncbi:dihydrolipoamide acetyltransferase family protein [Curvibacter sp. APW13]|uniref:dihydrolipoamide acetyltransferase family protein n=1 Tax=Curvibacter sp. APW13 TaxID=3077236 RepID=UPI0028DF7C88|nr:dihydrolipoamide acetyltransferase family protein [Curvibacter sp. APW13]MDT8989933.1 dihydrolipoamide acetyltransferase family protein [Curvibacter sp. APW13]